MSYVMWFIPEVCVRLIVLSAVFQFKSVTVNLHWIGHKELGALDDQWAFGALIVDRPHLCPCVSRGYCV